MSRAEAGYGEFVPRHGRPVVLAPATLGGHIAKITLGAVLTVMLAFAVLGFLVDLVEHLRDAADDGRPLFGAVELTALRLPTLLDRIWPFGVLFGAMFAFWRLNRSQELVAIRAAGVSAWQFLAPAGLVAVLLGGFVVTSLNPLGAALAARYERLQAQRGGDGAAQMSVFPGGMWLKQSRAGETLLVYAQRVRPEPEVVLAPVTVFVYDHDHTYRGRIDAPRAVLAGAAWVLDDARRSDDAGLNRPIGRYRIPTELDPATITRSFRDPATLSFWELPGYIALIEQLGFSARAHRVHFQSLLATPLFFAAMLLAGVTFTLRFVRTGLARMLPAGLIAGFSLFILVDVVRALGVAGQLPTVLAAWGPGVVALMLAGAALFQLEDG
jgi:lipopolysaccharide export system permease protein